MIYMVGEYLNALAIRSIQIVMACDGGGEKKRIKDVK